MNPYDVLNLRDTASRIEIEKAYKFYKNKYNPNEYNGDVQYAIKRMEDIEKAYKILSNLESRAAFDNRYNNHVKSHISKKDSFKEYYVTDPIGSHEHRDYEMAMKKYNSAKSNFDFRTEAIQSNGDEVFNDENIQDYSVYTSRKILYATIKPALFVLVIVILSTIFAPLYDVFKILSEESSKQGKPKYTYNSYTVKDIIKKNSKDKSENDNKNTSKKTLDESKQLEINERYTDDQLLMLYQDHYSHQFNTFYDFKTYYNNLYIQYKNDMNSAQHNNNN